MVCFCFDYNQQGLCGKKKLDNFALENFKKKNSFVENSVFILCM